MPSARFILPAMLILVLLVLTCGCGDYVPNHDIVVIVLHPDGTEAWTRTIDYGFDDVAGDILEDDNGDLVIAAGSANRTYASPSPELIRLGKDGTVIAEHSCPAIGGDLTSVIRTTDGNLSAASFEGLVGRFDRRDTLIGVTETGIGGVWSLAPAPDGGIAAAGTREFQYPAGTVAELDRNGAVSTRTPRQGEVAETPGCHETLLEAGDKKIPVTECVGDFRMAEQAAVTLMSRNGTILWQRGYGEYGMTNAWSLAAAGKGDGYYLDARGPMNEPGMNHSTFTARIAADGSPDWTAKGDLAMLWFPVQWDIRQGEVRAIIPREYPAHDGSIVIHPEVVTFNDRGNITSRLEIFPASRIIIPVSGGGFFSAGFYPGKDEYGYLDTGAYGGDEVHALKFRADGSREWEMVIRSVKVDTVKRVLQTADGSFVILAERQNR